MKIWLDPDWQHDGRTYRQTFALTPLDWCARYHLHVRTAAPVTVVLRGEVVASGSAPEVVADVTDFVSLDDNQLELCTAAAPARVWLEAVPCEGDE